MSVEVRSVAIPEWIRRICDNICTASEEVVLAKYADYIIQMISGEAENVTVDAEDIDAFCRLMAKLRIAARCPRAAQSALQGIDNDDTVVIEFY